MATIREYFDTDLKNDLKVGNTQSVGSLDGKLTVVIERNLHLDFDSHAKYISIFVPGNPELFGVCRFALSDLRPIFALTNDIQVSSGMVGENLVPANSLGFTGRVFLYHESTLSNEEVQNLNEFAISQGIALRVRGDAYAVERSKIDKPLAFICHDWRDKSTIARPLAVELSKMMCPVWFDEFSLKVGDSLRQNIEKGIKECKKCIVILSPSFFSNNGWTKVEFNSIFSREIIEKGHVILPVWHQVSKEQVYEYSPSLVDRLGVSTDLTIEEIARKLHKAIL